MEIQVFFGLVFLIHVILMFFDYFFKSCMLLPYLEFLQTSGFSIRFFRLQIYTTKINRIIIKWSSKIPNFYKHSFKLGCYITLLLFPVAMYFVIASLFSGTSKSANGKNISLPLAQTENVARLEILLPGVNLPVNQIGYYIIGLLICSIVHEAGHGISAVLDDVTVVGFGLQLMFIIPIAFTEIDMDQLQSVKLMKKLKIYSAGIWNNILLAGLSYVFLLCLPYILSPIYETNQSVFITSMREKAPVVGDNGLYVGDSITQINGCQVKNEEDWLSCLSDSILHRPAYCVSEDFVHDNEESVHEIEHRKDGIVSCCPSDSSLNCFENFDEERLPQYVCLNIRKTVEHSTNYCHKSICPQHSSCIKPILVNTSTIIHMKRKNRLKDLVYYGHPYDVLFSVKVSEFTPKTKVFEPWLGDAIALMLKYLAVFSSGLALINVVPCYGLDGQFLVNALISNLPSSTFSKSQKELISNSINLIGSGTLILATLKIFYTTFV